MDVLLIVDPVEKETVAKTIQDVDATLVSGAPETHEGIDAQSLIAFGLHASKHLDAVSVLVGALLAKNIKVRIEVGGIRLTAKTFKDVLALIRDLRKLLGGEQDIPKKTRTRK